MSHTREERETAIILSDSGTCTVWTTSPIRARHLLKRLGKPHRVVGDCHFWDIDPDSHSIPMPRRLGKPRKPPIGRQFSTKQPPSG
jgi:hypothetical protein